jgi:hypothetical protein
MLNIHPNWIAINDRGLFPENDVPVIILVEHDVVYHSDEEFPFTRKAMLIDVSKDKPYCGNIAWKLLDYDPETEEEILRQCFTVVAWRYYNYVNEPATFLHTDDYEPCRKNENI